jgi:hypothetical protein
LDIKEEFNNLYSSLNIVLAIETRREILAGCVARVGEMKNPKILFGNPAGKRDCRETRRR